jgi:hypothetical protein
MKKRAKRKRGRPSVWTPKLEAKICSDIETTGCSLRDVASANGIGQATLHEHLAKNAEFLERVTEARNQGKLKRVREIAANEEWRAKAWTLERQFPVEFAPRVFHHVEQELSKAINRLTEAFANEPSTLERALSAIAGETEVARAETGEPSEDAGGGEAVHGAHAVADTAGVPEP